MTVSLVTVTLLYVFLLALLLLVLTFSRLPVAFRFLLTLLVAGAYIFAYQTWKETQGWPGKLVMPSPFILHASVIEEPDPETRSSGRIFLWASTLRNAYPAAEPRAYEMRYTKQNHAALEKAKRQQMNGQVQIGSLKQPEGGSTLRQASQFGENASLLEFSGLPDPALPEK